MNTSSGLFLPALSGALLVAAIIITRIVYDTVNIPLLVTLLLFSGFAWVLFAATAQRTKNSATLLLLVIAAGIMLRLIFFTANPLTLSDDVYRYIWDGKVQANGINPYSHAPDSEQLKPLRDETVYPHVNHRSFKTSYPPASQLFFHAMWLTGSRAPLMAFRIAYLLFEVLLVFFIYRYAGVKAAIMVVSCPLLIIEIYAGMHLDIIIITLLAACVFSYRKKWIIPAFLLLGLSISVKYISIILLPVFLIEIFRENSNKGFFKALYGPAVALLCTTAGALLPFLPYLDAGSDIFTQLAVYARYWEFNGLAHKVAGLLSPGQARTILRFVTAILLGIIYLNRNIPFTKKCSLAFIAFLLLAPVFYPWYAFWLLPFAFVDMRKSELFLLAVLFLSYYILDQYKQNGVWEEHYLPMVLQFVPFYFLFAHDIFTGRYVQKQQNSGNNSRLE